MTLLSGVIKSLWAFGLVFGQEQSSIGSKEEAERFFSDEGIILFQGNNAFSFDTNIYPVDNTRFFYLRYEYKGEIVNKRLPSVGDEVVFNTSSIFRIDEKPVDIRKTKVYQLYYYESLMKKSLFLSSVNLLLKEETFWDHVISEFIEGNINRKFSSLLIGTSRYLKANYGNHDRGVLSEKLKETIKNKL